MGNRKSIRDGLEGVILIERAEKGIRRKKKERENLAVERRRSMDDVRDEVGDVVWIKVHETNTRG